MAQDGGIVIQPSAEIDKRFQLSVFDTKPAHKNTLLGLLQNGLYYMTVGNSISALASFSSAASYVYALKMDTNDTKYDTVLNSLLGYVEKLQVEAKRGAGSGGGGGGAGGKGKDDESGNEWDVECETFGCEEDPSKNCLTFKEVVGLKKEKETFFAAIAYPLIYPNLYTKAAKGLLLYGPPGTGKTFIIKAAVRELSMKFPDVKVLFFPLTGADLKGKYVGETEKKIVRAYTCAARRACQMTDVYNDVHPKQCLEKIHKEFEAKRAAAGPKEVWKKHPQYVSVVFIDEFDAVGGDRAKDESGMTANAVNTMLQMMDGLQSFGNVITVCATNFPWNLDSALLRRFNEQIYLNVPTMEDIKTLVTFEQKNRLKYFDENKRKYCAGSSMDKFFKASDQLQDFAGEKPLTAAQKQAKEAAAAAKDPCIKDGNKEGSIVDVIDKSYLNDKSPALIAAVSEMAEKHYSNSDVSSVMQKAFNIVSETALRSTVWQKVNYTNTAKKPPVEETYWVSRLTKLKGAEQDQLDTSLKAIENAANIDSKYAKNFFSLPENKMDLPANIYMDSSSTKSIFGEEIPADKTELKITSLKVYRENWDGIVKDSDNKTWVRDGTGKDAKWKTTKFNGLQTYTNMNFIANLPTILMFNDPSISQVFFNNEQVALLQWEIDSRKKKGSKDSTASTTEIDVIFTRVLDIEYPGSTPNTGDGIDNIIRAAGTLLNTITDLVGKEWDDEIVDKIEEDTTKVIKLFIQYIKIPENKSGLEYTKNKDGWEQIQRALDAFGKIGTNNLFRQIESTKKPRKTIFGITTQEAIDGVGPTVAYNTNRYSTNADSPESASYGVLAYIEYITLNNYMKKVIAREYWNKANVTAVKIDNASDEEIKTYCADTIKYNKGFIRFMEESELVQLKNVVEGSNEKNLKELAPLAREALKDGIKRLNSEAESIFTGEPFKTQKLFFFDAKIRPLSADWVQFKASGPTVTGGPKGIIGSIGGMFSSIKSRLSTYFSGKNDILENLETTVASRIAEAGIPMSKYLLTRTVNVGVLEVSDEKNILIVNKEAATLDALEKLITTDDSGASSPRSDPGSVASTPKDQRGGSKKQTKKLKRGGAGKGSQTRKNTGTSKEFEYKYIHWFSMVKGSNSTKFDKMHFNQSFFTLESITSTLLLSGAGGAVAGAAGMAASYFGLLGSFAVAGVSIAATPIAIGTAATVLLASALTVGKAASTTVESSSNNVISASERILFNQMLGYWYTFKSPEDNIYIVNLMFAEVFGGESLEIKNPIIAGVQSDWSMRLPATFTENYMMALKARERILTQVAEYAYLKPVKIIGGLEGNKSTINIKKMGDSQVDEKSLNKSNFLSFYMDASFITAAMKSYPSTYNPVTGGLLNDYNKNRTKFLEDYAAGKYDKKK